MYTAEPTINWDVLSGVGTKRDPFLNFLNYHHPERNEAFDKVELTTKVPHGDFDYTVLTFSKSICPHDFQLYKLYLVPRGTFHRFDRMGCTLFMLESPALNYYERNEIYQAALPAEALQNEHQKLRVAIADSTKAAAEEARRDVTYTLMVTNPEHKYDNSIMGAGNLLPRGFVKTVAEKSMQLKDGKMRDVYGLSLLWKIAVAGSGVRRKDKKREEATLSTIYD